MVVTSLPAARESGVTHDRTASPSRWTVHAPHSAIPQGVSARRQHHVHEEPADTPIAVRIGVNVDEDE